MRRKWNLRVWRIGPFGCCNDTYLGTSERRYTTSRMESTAGITFADGGRKDGYALANDFKVLSPSGRSLKAHAPYMRSVMMGFGGVELQGK